MQHLKAITLTTLALLPAGALAACGSSNTTGSANAAVSGTTPAGMPAGGPPAGMGTVVTGEAAEKATAAATAKYEGTVERVMQLDDGSYVVHVMTSSGEQHVKVSAAFKVTGLDTSMPAPPNGAGPGGAGGTGAAGPNGAGSANGTGPGGPGGADPNGAAPQSTTPTNSTAS
jgi:hypothetical protein